MTIADLGLGIVPISVVATVGAIAAVTDLSVYKVHNTLTIPFAVAGLLFHGLTAGAWGLGFSLLGLFVGFASLVVFYALGGIGAGDVKLMAGIGAWLGGWTTVHVLIMSGIAAGMYSLVLLLSCGGIRHVMTNVSILVFRIRAMAVHFGQDERVETVVADVGGRRRRLVPFAVMVLIGIVCLMLGVNSAIGL